MTMDACDALLRSLSEAQKVRLSVDFSGLTDAEATDMRANLPRMVCASLDSVAGDGMPSPTVLARSWDVALTADVSAHLCRQAARDGARYVFLPDAKATMGDDALSEDPVLAGTVAGAYAVGANRAGVAACVQVTPMTAAEADGASPWTVARCTDTHVLRPAEAVLAAGVCVGVVVEDDSHAARWQTGTDGESRVVFRRCSSDGETVRAVRDGQICLGGSATALQRALHRYRRLKAAIEQGHATTGELEAAVEAGEALSEEAVDAALARLSALTSTPTATAAMPSATHENDEALAARAVRASAVLLENRNRCLPLTRAAKVCVIGAMAEASGDMADWTAYLAAHGHTYMGYAPGYAETFDRSEALADEACRLAAEAEVILFFVGDTHRAVATPRAEGGLRRPLPADRLALCDRLARMGKQLVVILGGESYVDMSFVSAAQHPFDAVLLAPLEVAGGAARAVELVLGMYAPAGRLTETLTAGSDPAADRSSLRIGPFVGYRYYDTVGCGAAYPFGHGLTYTTFRYTGLQVMDGTLSFTVRNVGQRAGVEVAQVYLGMERSAVLRPKKELIGYARVELEPGQETVVTLPWRPLPVPVEDGNGWSSKTEKGMYTLYVGASVADIRLVHTVAAGECVLPSDGEVASDYLATATNILNDEYTLEAAYTPMKAALRNLIFGIAALVLAVSVKIYDIVTLAPSAFLNILAALLTVGAAVFFAMEFRDRRRQLTRERQEMEAADLALFENAVTISAPTVAALFAEAEDTTVAASDHTAVGDTAGVSGEYDYYAEADPSLTLPVAARELTVLAAEKGIVLEPADARSILAALATSRLLFVQGMDDEDFSELLALLCAYFDCPLAVDAVDEGYTSEASVLFSTDEAGTRAETSVGRAMAAARERKNIHIAALTGVSWTGLSAYFVPFVRYAHTPTCACTVTVPNGEGAEATYTIPENLWFILQLKDGERPEGIPEYMAEVATVQAWSIGHAEAVEAHAELHHMGYGQLLYLCDRLKATPLPDESLWKKIDRLEAYARRYGELCIGNKLWLGMETYLAVLLEAGSELTDALDETIAVKLLPSVLRVLSGQLTREDRGPGEMLDAILGDDHTERCRRVIKAAGMTSL